MLFYKKALILFYYSLKAIKELVKKLSEQIINAIKTGKVL